MPDVGEQERQQTYKAWMWMKTAGESALRSAINLPYQLRYGVTAPEKEAFALSGQAPGAQSPAGPKTPREMALANRAAAVYLGGRKWGTGPAQAFNIAREGIKGALGYGYDNEMIRTGMEAAQAAEAKGPSKFRDIMNRRAKKRFDRRGSETFIRG